MRGEGNAFWVKRVVTGRFHVHHFFLSSSLSSCACSSSSSSSGLQQKVDSLSKLRVSGLVLGPVHVAPPDEALAVQFEELSPELGSLAQFKEMLRVLHMKGEEDSGVSAEQTMVFLADTHPPLSLQGSPWFWT